MRKSSSGSKSLTEMSNDQRMPNNHGPLPRRRWQYGIGTMLLIMIPLSLLAGALSGMLNPENSSVRLPRAFYVVLAIIAPMGLMVALSAILVLRKWLADKKRRASKSNEQDR